MSDLRIKTCAIGMVITNCYFAYHEKTREAVIIDPADNCEYILKLCKDLNISLKAILLTHGHFDHMLAAEELRLSCRCPIYASREEDRLLFDPALNLSGSFGTEQTAFHADHLVDDKEKLQLIGFTWKVIITPGHTAGSACYWLESEGVLFSGDTLFLESVGRTDLPTGSSSEIIKSVAEKLFLLPDNTMVYPGHGDPTTITHEKQYNPVVIYRR